MAKFYGPVGYAETVETAPGVYVEKITERMYFGDLTRNTRRLQSSETLNDDINVANEISIVADPFANQNFHRMRYVGFMGANWKISNVEVHYPRLPYALHDRYQVTAIYRNPDSEIPSKIALLPMCSHERHYTKENLNHDVFNLYF